MWPPRRTSEGRKVPESKREPVDLDGLRIVDAEPPQKRLVTNRYEALFVRLKPGKALECLPEDTARIATALRTWLKRTNRPGKVWASSAVRVMKGEKLTIVGHVGYITEGA